MVAGNLLVRAESRRSVGLRLAVIGNTKSGESPAEAGCLAPGTELRLELRWPRLVSATCPSYGVTSQETRS